MSIRKKLVIVGDECCGKKSILDVFYKDKSTINYVSTVYENYMVDILIDSELIGLFLIDVSGQEEFDKTRQLIYPDTDVVLMCFSIDSTDSFKSVTQKWIPEVKHFCPNAPIILVGNKSDLRNENSDRKDDKNQMGIIKYKKGKSLAKKIGAHAYVECSAKTTNGVREVFETATKAALKLKKK